MVSTIAVDLAKTAFQVALANRAGRVVRRQRCTRGQFEKLLRTTAPAHVVMEACGTAHYWGRLAQDVGHRVSLLPPRYVRPYIQRDKTDRADADALLEALRNPRIVPVPVKSVPQQELVALHRIRDQWMATRTARLNSLRGVLREHGLLVPMGATRPLTAIPLLLADATGPLPSCLRHTLGLLYQEIRELETRIATLERDLAALVASDPVSQRLQTVPGVGLLTATAVRGTVGNIHTFRRARQFACWLGLTAREHSTGNRRRLGSITKQGDVYLRYLLTHGARAVLLAAQRRHRAGQPLTRLQQWAVAVAQRRGHNRATIAVANNWRSDAVVQRLAARARDCPSWPGDWDLLIEAEYTTAPRLAPPSSASTCQPGGVHIGRVMRPFHFMSNGSQ